MTGGRQGISRLAKMKCKLNFLLDGETMVVILREGIIAAMDDLVREGLL